MAEAATRKQSVLVYWHCSKCKRKEWGATMDYKVWDKTHGKPIMRFKTKDELKPVRCFCGGKEGTPTMKLYYTRGNEGADDILPAIGLRVALSGMHGGSPAMEERELESDEMAVIPVPESWGPKGSGETGEKVQPGIEAGPNPLAPKAADPDDVFEKGDFGK